MAVGGVMAIYRVYRIETAKNGPNIANSNLMFLKETIRQRYRYQPRQLVS